MGRLTRVVKTKKFGLIALVILAGTIASFVLRHTSAATFPTTPVLDNFNRAGTTAPPSANWTFGQEDNGNLALAGDSATATSSAVGANLDEGDYWNASTFGPN